MDRPTPPDVEAVLTSAAAVKPPHGEERPLFAMALRLGAMLSIAISFATVKYINARGVSVIETIFFRQLIALPIVFFWILAFQGVGTIRTKRLGGHATRTILGMIGLALNFGTYILLPLTEATAIGFTMPIFGTIMGALLLKEATGIHRWAAVCLGFVGVLIMVRPDTGHLPVFGLTVALSAAIVTAVISIVLRQLGKTEGAAVTVFWFTFLSVPPLGILMLFFARSHDPATWALVGLMGVTGGIAQLGMTGALRWAPVSVVLPMDYSTILWATIIGWLVWGEWPILTTFIGAILIIASGLYIAWREHVRARQARVALRAA